MSVNVKTVNGLKQIADITTKNKVLKVLGYTPANEEDLINHRGDTDIHISSFEREKWNSKPETYEQLKEKPSISEEDTTVLSIVDENNYIIAFVDAMGIHTTALEVITENGKRDIVEFIKENLLELNTNIDEAITDVRNKIITDYNKLDNIPIENESVDDTLYISDFNGNIIAKFDINGLSTINVNSKELFENGVSLINKYSTKAELETELAKLVDSSPTTLDTLNELAAALGDDPNFATTITNLVGTKLGRNEQSVDSAKLGGIEADKYVLDTELEQTKSALNKAISNVRDEIIDDYNELKNRPIENENIDNTLYITDIQGNVIARFDSNGLNTTIVNSKELFENGVSLINKYSTKAELEQTKNNIDEAITDVRNKIITDYNKLDNIPIENESVDDTLYITDKNGNIVAFIDHKGIDAVNLYINHKEAALKEDVKELKEDVEEFKVYVEKFTTEDEVSDLIESNVPGFAYDSDLEQVTERQTKTENDLSTLSKNVDTVSSKANDAYNLAKKADAEHFSGDYNELKNRPIENESVDDTLYITDKNGNIVASFDSNGLRVTNVNSKELFENGVSLINKYSTVEKANSLSSSLEQISLALSTNTYGFAKTSSVGQASGIAPLDATGKIASSYLPSYVDDVLDYTGKNYFPTIGETGKIYVDTTKNISYRWSGSQYVEISSSLALGETSSTAYPGDKGAANAIAISNLQSGKLDKTAQSVDSAKLGGIEADKYVLDTELEQTKKDINNELSNVRNKIITDYNKLDNKLPIEELDSREFKIVDGKSNIIMKVNNEGIHTTELYADDVKINTVTHVSSIDDLYIKKSAALSALEIDALLKFD